MFVPRVALLVGVLVPPCLAQDPPNLLLVIADDLGVYELACFGEGSDPAVTPTIDQLALEGVRFPHCYSNPLCTPTRATIQTGRYALHTGCGALLTTSWGLQLEELTVAEALADAPVPYHRGYFGKWHLSNEACGRHLAPNASGYDHAVWTVHNLVTPQDYYQWEEIEDGVLSSRDGYVTSHVVDRALEWTATVPEPWFVVLSFHAGHDPFHRPPEGLYSQDLTEAGPGNPRPYYKAMIEALDAELGRFLYEIGDARARTNVVFVGDNGSPPPTIGPPGIPQKSKGSLYEGGINVPLIVSGPAVVAPGASSSALVNTTDLFRTLLDLAGVPVTPEQSETLKLNSVSVVPYLTDPYQDSLRKITYSEWFLPSGFAAQKYIAAARDRRFKLIARYPPIQFELYDLMLDPSESTNLLLAPLSQPAQAAYQALKADVVKKLNEYFE